MSDTDLPATPYPALDALAALRAAPDLYLVLLPDLRIIEVSDAVIESLLAGRP